MKIKVIKCLECGELFLFPFEKKCKTKNCIMKWRSRLIHEVNINEKDLSQIYERGKKMCDNKDIEDRLVYLTEVIKSQFENLPFVLVLSGLHGVKKGNSIFVSTLTNEGTILVLGDAIKAIKNGKELP